MRQQSAVQVRVRDTVIGGVKPLICLPMMGETREQLISETEELVSRKPDLLEWRIDAYEQVEDIEASLLCLQKVREIAGNIPILFTCRIDREGGLRKIDQAKRLELYCAAIDSGWVDIVDIELCNEREFVAAVKEKAVAVNVKLILSYHNFKETPSESFLYAKLVEARLVGADISKIAVMPKNYGDVLTLLGASNNARNEGVVQGPIVTISMGGQGTISRLAGGLFGSDITFGRGVQTSAPGQISMEALRFAESLLYGPQQ